MADAGGTPEYVHTNVAAWQARGDDQRALAARAWAQEVPSWGIFRVPEPLVGFLPTEISGLDVVELGCGTAYISAWLARRGARPVAVDPTPGQLAIAAECQLRYDLTFPLVRAAAEQMPMADGSFDLAVSEYGAAIWAEPASWIAEAARLLRPGGELIFLGTSTLLALCEPDVDHIAATDRLLRPQFGMHRFEWPDDPGIEFHMSHGDWIRLLVANDFEIEDLIEVRPPDGAPTSYEFVTAEWAAQWPCEEIWKARRR